MHAVTKQTKWGVRTVFGEAQYEQAKTKAPRYMTTPMAAILKTLVTPLRNVTVDSCNTTIFWALLEAAHQGFELMTTSMSATVSTGSK
mmetsp:Transcript_52371/g.126108  ORF Transcript_52371/g.126108 Transcript_52371/m.126108 type:complete len:88 (-) Transcript_52371:439-702(-)